MTAASPLHDDAEVRVIIEKPFGTSLEEALELNRQVLDVFEETQVFRIDHYLGKETVQNMMAFRFANGMFEPLWNRNYIDSVQITAAEDIGIGTRAGFYDQTGALRDLIQNHMLQLLCHVAMEPPVSFTAEEVRNEKVKVLHAIHAPQPAEIAEIAVRAQYAAGHSGGEDVPGYLEEDGVREGSTTETFAALRLEVDNWRWAGVPFYLRAGKRLARKITEIAVTLKPVPHLAFSQDGSLGVKPNQLVLTLQPNEGVTLQLGAKIPGTRMRIRSVNMEFLYGTSFMSQSPEAYERLIMDAMRGDPTLFTRNDEVEAQWRICDPILQAWESARTTRCRNTRPARRGRGGGRPAARRPPLARDLIRCPPSATRFGASRERRRTRSKRRCAGCSPSATPKTAASCPRACSTWSRSSRASTAGRSPTACAASAATTPRAWSCSPTSPTARAWTPTRASPPRARPRIPGTSCCCTRP